MRRIFRPTSAHIGYEALEGTGAYPRVTQKKGGALARASIPLDILAASLGIRLTPEELEWLSMALKERAEQRRSEAGSEVPVLAGYRDAWEPVRRNTA